MLDILSSLEVILTCASASLHEVGTTSTIRTCRVLLLERLYDLGEVAAGLLTRACQQRVGGRGAEYLLGT